MPFRILYNASTDSTSVIFKTHLNYIRCIKRLTNGMAINISTNPTARLDPSRIEKFITLCGITRMSIEGERNACRQEVTYAQVASPWIPVKGYYLLYYLESIFLFLLTGSEIGFSHGGHSGVKKQILQLLEDRTISLTSGDTTELSKVVDWTTANNFHTNIGATITHNYHSNPNCIDSLRKKLTEYIEIDWKNKEKIKTYRTLEARQKKASELMPKKLCLLDYFYWMRIKSNYRDVDFLDFDNHVNELDAYEYLENYIEATYNYASALEGAIANLKRSRRM